MEGKEKYRYIKIAAIYCVAAHIMNSLFGFPLTEFLGIAFPVVMLAASVVIATAVHYDKSDKMDFLAIISALGGTLLFIIIEVVKTIMFLKWIGV